MFASPTISAFQVIRNFFLIFIPITVLSNLVYLVSIGVDDTILFAEAGSTFMSCLFFVIYVLSIGTHLAEVKEIFNKFYELTKPDDQESYNAIKSSAHAVKIISIAVITTNIPFIVCYLSIPYIQTYLNYKKFPNETISLPLIWYQWYPWDTNTHPYWELSLLSEMMLSIALFNLFLGFDTMFSGIIAVAAGQFKLLQRYLENLTTTAKFNLGLTEIPNSDEAQELMVIEMEKLLKTYVDRHNKLIK